MQEFGIYGGYFCDRQLNKQIMPNLNLDIERVQKYLSKIKFKYGEVNEDSDSYFISKIHISNNNIKNISTLYGDGKLYEATEIAIGSGDKEREEDMVLLHIGFNPDTECYDDLLSDGQGVYLNFADLTESYDEFEDFIVSIRSSPSPINISTFLYLSPKILCGH